MQVYICLGAFSRLDFAEVSTPTTNRSRWQKRSAEEKENEAPAIRWRGQRDKKSYRSTSKQKKPKRERERGGGVDRHFRDDRKEIHTCSST